MPKPFEQLSLSDVEELVGKKALAVDIERKWIVATFGGGVTGQGSLAADVRVKFRNW